MYTASMGMFSETTPTQSVTSWQNSPISLGLSSYYNIKTRAHAILSTLYFSELKASKVKGNTLNSDQTPTIPMEIGVNLYYQYTYDYEYPAIYGGVDREVFTSYNIGEMAPGDSLTMRQNTLYFLTVGLTKVINVYSHDVTVKGSMAKNFSSSSSSGNPDDVFNGTRLLCYLSLKGKNNFSYNFLYKRMSLKGPTALLINRVGLGVGWQFY